MPVSQVHSFLSMAALQEPVQLYKCDSFCTVVHNVVQEPAGLWGVLLKWEPSPRGELTEVDLLSSSKRWVRGNLIADVPSEGIFLCYHCVLISSNDGAKSNTVNGSTIV